MSEQIARVKGIGGVFIYANNPKALVDWYAEHLGLSFTSYEEANCYWLEFCYYDADDLSRKTHTVFSIGAAKSDLPPDRHQFMVNYRVDEIERFLDQLRSKGVEIEKQEDYEYGRFAWITDPEGNRIELYQPLIEPTCGSS